MKSFYVCTYFLFLLLFTNFNLTAQSNSPLTFSEIMFYPSESNGEFIEIYNTSSTQVIDLTQIRFKYYTASVDSFITFIGGTLLAPESFAVVIENDYDFENGIYKNLIPKDVIILKTADNAFGSTGMANTASRTVSLLSNTGEILDSYDYTADNSADISDEKIFLGRDNSTANWTNSLVLNGTPGISNSVTPLLNDVLVENFSFDTKYGIDSKPVTAKFVVKNNGLNPASEVSVKIFHDLNSDSSGQTNELIKEFSNQFIDSGGVKSYSFQVTDYNYGVNNFIVTAEFDADKYPDNNTAYASFTGVQTNEQRDDLVINEFMYTPESPEPEWIEIYNRSDKTVDLFHYKISDRNDTTIVIDFPLLLVPDEYFVIAKDSSIFGIYQIPSKIAIHSFSALNNSGDRIMILDSLNRVIDSLEYMPTWGGSNGKSLERILPEDSSTINSNWKTSENIFGATPGYKNSVTPKKFDLAVTRFNFKSHYVFDNNEAEGNVTIKNYGTAAAENYSLSIFKDLNGNNKPDAGESLYQFTAMPVNKDDSITYNFKLQNRNNQLLGINTYLAFVSYEPDENRTNNLMSTVLTGIITNEQRNDLVINEIMYAPSSAEPEWIELYNRSQKTINLLGYRISDDSQTSIIVNDSLKLLPNEYFVIAKDSSIFNKYIISSKYVVTSFPILNNTSDEVVLIDQYGRVIDSLFYNSAWGGTGGKSLERIDAASSSVDPLNWESSNDEKGATPGEINSVSKKEFDVSVADLIFNPAQPEVNQKVSISAEVKNIGYEGAEFSIILFQQDLAGKENVLESASLILASGDSAIYNFNYWVNKIVSELTFGVKVVYSLDQDTTNNKLIKSIRPYYANNSIAINEIMFNPFDGESEWFEILNISDNPVNLKNWSVSDILPFPKKTILTDKEIILQPGEFAVITNDSLNYSFYPPEKFFQADFETLGNTEDGVIIYDFRGTVIDSVKYNSSWDSQKGHSIEKLFSTKSGIDSTNWLASLNSDGATPGFLNSVANIPSYSAGSLIINEVMFDPAAGNSEFIEFYNVSEDSLEVGGWAIEKASGQRVKLSVVSLMLPPNQYFVLAADSSILKNYNWLNLFPYLTIVNQSSFNLGNTGDEIILKDLHRKTIDSLYYSSSWNNKNILVTKNKSLERINPDISTNDFNNWSTSVDFYGATPGKVNSIFAKNTNKEAKVTIEPNPFSPDNDGFEDFTVINLNLTQKISQVRIKVYDSTGRLVRTIADNKAVGSNSSIIFDGLGDSGNPLRIGIYILFIEAISTDNAVIETLKAPVVIARKL